MHMADALISPAVGGSFWVASAALIGACAHKTQKNLEDHAIPMMGVLGAFVFAAQMVNYTIPLTGSSGHIGGGLLLAILLGPSAGFLVMASVLAVQAFFFMDGGLLALGCNIFNLGFFPCFVAYPLVFSPLAGASASPRRLALAAVPATIVGLELGAIGVITQTLFSGMSSLSFGAFAALMLPLHLAIGLVEGVVTATIVALVSRSHPGSIAHWNRMPPSRSTALALAKVFIPVTAVVAIALAWFASSHPDGLEYSLEKIGWGGEISEPQEGLHKTLAQTQESTAIFPDYQPSSSKPSGASNEGPAQESWPAIDPGTSLAGLVGGMITMMTIFLIGIMLHFGKTRVRSNKAA